MSKAEIAFQQAMTDAQVKADQDFDDEGPNSLEVLQGLDEQREYFRNLKSITDTETESIENLKAAEAKLREMVNNFVDEIGKLQAENRKLRDLLIDMRYFVTPIPNSDYWKATAAQFREVLE